MFQKILFYTCILLILAMAPAAYAGKVELTTYYPAPYGEYKQLKARGNDANNSTIALETGGNAGTGLVVTNANNVAIGTATPTAGYKLDINGKARSTASIAEITASADGKDLTTKEYVDALGGLPLGARVIGPIANSVGVPVFSVVSCPADKSLVATGCLWYVGPQLTGTTSSSPISGTNNTGGSTCGTSIAGQGVQATAWCCSH